MEETGGLHEQPVTGVEERDGAVIVQLAGELDLYNAHVVREQLFAAAASEPERLIVELSAVTFIDSTGLGVLIEARTRGVRTARAPTAPSSLRAARASARALTKRQVSAASMSATPTFTPASRNG